ncbi:MAG TPA: tyrosinase family protein [Thermoanaerobaculia bacterium]|nr:tyrosinase family protein [Thermoanaerobaculia bacterium]
MDHSQHSHPQTFDEVIARGFPLADLQSLAKAQRERPRQQVAPSAAKLQLLSVGAPAVRKDQAALTAGDQEAFRQAVSRLVDEGKYAELVQIHMDMSHNMHGSMGETGLYRFLGWHRRYLLEVEHELQRVDALLRPKVTEKLGIPYWRWQDPFPAWLTNFLPAKDPISGGPAPLRKTAAPPQKANGQDVATIVGDFRIQNTGLPNENDYTKFTYALEGWGLRPNNTSLPAHNQGHAWIGGIMNNTRTSPADPIFWLHHAEVDRLWQSWRQKNPNPGPLLTGGDRIMDPWPDLYDDLLDIAALGVAYDSLSP